MVEDDGLVLGLEGTDVVTLDGVETVLTLVEVELATDVVVLGEVADDMLVVGTLVVEGTVVLVDVVELGDELRVLDLIVVLVVIDVTLEVGDDLTVDVVGEGLDEGTDVVALGLLVGTLVVVGTVLVELFVLDVGELVVDFVGNDWKENGLELEVNVLGPDVPDVCDLEDVNTTLD